MVCWYHQEKRARAMSLLLDPPNDTSPVHAADMIAIEKEDG
jgi:hypothetical protein